MVAPEFKSVEAFVQFLMDDERTSVTYEEAVELAEAIGQSVPTLVIRALKGYGITVGARPVAKAVRGFNSNSHDRWFGKGSCPTHGGSGWEQINGFAGQEG